MMIYQWVYSCFNWNIKSSPGFGVFSYSEGLSDNDLNELTLRLIPYPFECPQNKKPSDMPLIFFAFQLPSKKFVILQERYIGKCFNGRNGNYIAHALISDEYWPHPTACYIGSETFWADIPDEFKAGAASTNGGGRQEPPPYLPVLSEVNPHVLPSELDAILETDTMFFNSFLQFFTDFLKGRKISLAVPPLLFTRYVGTLQSFLPPALAAQIPIAYAEWHFDKTDDYHIVGPDNQNTIFDTTKQADLSRFRKLSVMAEHKAEYNEFLSHFNCSSLNDVKYVINYFSKMPNAPAAQIPLGGGTDSGGDSRPNAPAAHIPLGVIVMSDTPLPNAPAAHFPLGEYVDVFSYCIKKGDDCIKKGDDFIQNKLFDIIVSQITMGTSQNEIKKFYELGDALPASLMEKFNLKIYGLFSDDPVKMAEEYPFIAEASHGIFAQTVKKHILDMEHITEKDFYMLLLLDEESANSINPNKLANGLLWEKLLVWVYDNHRKIFEEILRLCDMDKLLQDTNWLNQTENEFNQRILNHLLKIGKHNLAKIIASIMLEKSNQKEDCFFRLMLDFKNATMDDFGTFFFSLYQNQQFPTTEENCKCFLAPLDAIEDSELRCKILSLIFERYNKFIPEKANLKCLNEFLCETSKKNPDFQAPKFLFLRAILPYGFPLPTYINSFEDIFGWARSVSNNNADEFFTKQLYDWLLPIYCNHTKVEYKSFELKLLNILKTTQDTPRDFLCQLWEDCHKQQCLALSAQVLLVHLLSSDPKNPPPTLDLWVNDVIAILFIDFTKKEFKKLVDNDKGKQQLKDLLHSTEAGKKIINEIAKRPTPSFIHRLTHKRKNFLQAPRKSSISSILGSD